MCSHVIQLAEAASSLANKTEALTVLETKVSELQASLDEATAQLETKGSSLAEAEETKSKIEQELSDVKAALEKAQSERVGDDSALQTVQQEVWQQSSIC